MSYKKAIRSNWNRSRKRAEARGEEIESRADYYHEMRRTAFFAGRFYGMPPRKFKRRKSHGFLKGIHSFENKTKENRKAAARYERHTSKQRGYTDE